MFSLHLIIDVTVLGRVAAMLIRTLGVSQIEVISRGDYHDHATLFQNDRPGAFLHIAQEYDILITSHITYSLGLNLTILKQSSTRMLLVILPPSAAFDVHV